jgi:tRNA threonylcarbamoyladenosine biosynthesis protein TsaB
VLILSLDTSTPVGSTAVLESGRVRAARAGDPAQPHATRLPGDVLAVLGDVGATLDDLDGLVVGLGPGAFTGLRVGIAHVQGLSMALDVPVAGVSVFDALAAAVLAPSIADLRTRDDDWDPIEADVVGVWLDGARREVFAARYARDHEGMFGIRMLDEPRSAAADQVLRAWREHPPQPDVWTGEGVALYAPVLMEGLGGSFEVAAPPTLRAIPIGALGARLHERGLAGPPHALRPVYVRRSDAELARDRHNFGPGREGKGEEEATPVPPAPTS